MTQQEALKELMKLAKSGTLEIYEWGKADMYGGGRKYDIDWDAPLKGKEFSDDENKWL